MSVRKRKWRDKKGRQHERWMVRIEHTRADGTVQVLRRVSPIQWIDIILLAEGEDAIDKPADFDCYGR